MSKTQTPATTAHTARQLAVVLRNSKYTYQHLKAFHQTVLGLLESADLSVLHPSKTKNVIFFILTVVRILKVPTNVIPSDSYQTIMTSSFCMHEQPIQFNYSKANLQILLGWLDQIVLKKHITIEEILDQFYSLKLHQDIALN
jgi:hypothetical protein